MTHGGCALFRSVHMLALVAALCIPTPSFADDYSEVSRLVRSGQLTEALEAADRYLATKPRDPQMRFLKGVAQSEAGRKGEAIETFLALTQEYPELPEPYNNLAVLYAGRREFDKARNALESAIRTNPSYATAHENLGDVYAQLASQSYSRAQQLDSGNPSVRPKLALIRQLLSTGGKNAEKPAAAGSNNSSGAGENRPAAQGG
jgi:tetratricopeptide (TPR) repeat protein